MGLQGHGEEDRCPPRKTLQEFQVQASSQPRHVPGGRIEEAASGPLLPGPLRRGSAPQDGPTRKGAYSGKTLFSAIFLDMSRRLRVGVLSFFCGFEQVEQVIKEQNMFDVYAIIEGYCVLLEERVNVIEEQK